MFSLSNICKQFMFSLLCSLILDTNFACPLYSSITFSSMFFKLGIFFYLILFLKNKITDHFWLFSAQDLHGDPWLVLSFISFLHRHWMYWMPGPVWEKGEMLGGLEGNEVNKFQCSSFVNTDVSPPLPHLLLFWRICGFLSSLYWVSCFNMFTDASSIFNLKISLVALRKILHSLPLHCSCSLLFLFCFALSFFFFRNNMNEKTHLLRNSKVGLLFPVFNDSCNNL